MAEILASSVAISTVLLPLLGWRWRIRFRVSIPASFAIGILAGLLTAMINLANPGLSEALLLLVEAAIVLFIAFATIAIRFYRDPERHPSETRNVVLSPADGTVIYVRTVEIGSSLVSTKGNEVFRLNELADTDLLQNTSYLMGIEMNILNVHVNRSPIGGKVIYQRRTKGRFMSLRRPESERVNERVTTVVRDGAVTVGVIQIASRLVRRITSYVGERDEVRIGQRIGMIAFGSQVDVAIPELERLELRVRPGDKVKAGVSVLARYGQDGNIG